MQSWLRRVSFVGIGLACACALVALCAGSAAARPGPVNTGEGGTHALVRLTQETSPTGLPVHTALPSRAQLRTPLTVTVVLKRQRQAAFERYLSAVREPSSSLYGHFLSPAQQAVRFGPSRAIYEQVKAWLRRRGLDVTGGSANRLSLTARGTAAVVGRAFDTTIRGFRVGGRSVYANLQAPAVPRRLASRVQAVTGLDDLDAPLGAPPVAPSDQHLCEHSSSLAETPGNKKFKKTCANLCRANAEKALPRSFLEVLYELLLLRLRPIFSLANTAVNGGNSTWGFIGYCIGVSLTESNPEFGNWFSEHREEIEEFKKHFKEGVFEYRRRDSEHSSLHGLPGSFSAVAPDTLASPQARPLGPIQKIGLLEFDTYSRSDVTDWLNLEGIEPGLTNQLSEVNVNGGVANPGAGESEVLLDIDTVIGAAPFARYVVYDAPPDTSFVQIFQTMIADGDDVISNSWSQCEDQTPIAQAQAIDSVLASAAASGITVLNGTGDGGSTCLDGNPGTIGVPADSPNATSVGGTSPEFGPGLSYGSESWWDEQEADPAGGAGGYGVSRYFSRPSYQDGLTSSSMRSVPDLSFIADPHAGVTLCQADAGGCPDGQLWGGTSMATPAVAGLVADLNEELGHNVGDLNTALYPLAGTGVFHSAAGMESDFAHVGLGSPIFGAIYQALSGTTTGAVSAASSTAGGVGHPQADGNEEGIVRVDLSDESGAPIGGKQVTLTPGPGSDAVISPASAITSAGGTAVFTITDTTAQTVTFEAKDATDGVTLASEPHLTFETPVASGSSIAATPNTVENDGTSYSTISVYLENLFGRPAEGKTVLLTAADGGATIAPGGEIETDGDGVAQFKVSDSNEETVSFSATDVSDGNLPVPGSVQVSFEPSGTTVCSDTLPTAASGFSVSRWASGFAYNPQSITTFGGGFAFTTPACRGVISAPAFNASGSAYVPDEQTGQIFVFGPAGGSASSATALPDTSLEPILQLGGIAFGKEGQLYAGLEATKGSPSEPQLVQLNPATGATERVLATRSSGLAPCPLNIAVDPLSGDVFTADECSGSLASDAITRVANPDSATPAASVYTGVPGFAFALAFAPDGTLYATVPSTNEIVEITPTNVSPTKVTTVATLSGYTPWGISVAASDSKGHATMLDITDTSDDVIQVSLPAPVVTTTLASGGGFLWMDTVGPDGCLYVDELDLLLKLTGNTIKCAGSSGNAGPQITLSREGSSTPATGSTASFIAKLEDVENPQGTPIHFLVSGANTQTKLVDTDGSGAASFGYAGVFAGADTVTAIADAGGEPIESAPIVFRWTAGKDTSYLSLNASQGGGALGQPATLRASLTDVSTEPATPIAGASVTLSLAGASCVASTDSMGNASCTVQPPGGLGLDEVTASYAGSETYTASTASNVFEAGGIGLPQPSPSNSSTSSTATGVPATQTTKARPAISDQPADLCGTVNVDLLDVYVAAGRLHLLGYANPRLAGKKVAIKSTWNGRIVAHATVSTNGYFSATAAPPAARLRTSNRTRYQALVGTYRSSALKLSRRLYVFTLAAAGHGKVTISGQVLGPLTHPPAPLRVTMRESCQTGYKTLKATVKLNHATGRFTVSAPAPPADAPGAVYRLHTHVRDSARSRHSFATESLPRVIGH